jgi:hypothetical protein
MSGSVIYVEYVKNILESLGIEQAVTEYIRHPGKVIQELTFKTAKEKPRHIK